MDMKIVGKSSNEMVEVDNSTNGLRVGVFDPITGMPVTLQGGASINVRIGDTSSRDAFARLRVSLQTCVWSTSFWNGINTDVLEVGGTNNTSVINNDGTTNLTCTTNAVGNIAWIQSFIPIRYEPGQSRLVRMTFAPMALHSGVQMRIGPYSDDGTGVGNGIYIEFTGAQVNLVRRWYNGSQTMEERISQNFWNQDTFTGSDLTPWMGQIAGDVLSKISTNTANPSGLYLNWELMQHLVVDYQFLGVGRIRVGWDIGGEIYWAHWFQASNSLPMPWAETGSIPLRAEVKQVTATQIIPVFKLCNWAAFDEGQQSYAYTYKSIPPSALRTVTTGAVALVALPVYSWQLKNTNNATKRAVWIPSRISITQTVATVGWGWALVIKSTGLTSATFANTAWSNVVNIDTAATAVTAPVNSVATGYIIASGVGFGTGAQAWDVRPDIDQNNLNLMRLTSNAAGTTQFTASLIVYPLGAAAVTCIADVDWKELV
jgi:hypothetical protein